MRLALLASGRLRERYARLAAELYEKRIRKRAPFEVVEVREPRGGDADATGERLLARLREDDRVVLLSPGGRELTSEEVAGLVGRALAAGRGRLVFVVGGPYGTGRAMAGRADEKLSLGRMTLTHELARVVLLEQVYRALTILEGGSYHHG
jgi:23S rRNA (pseudouridine1915-N3)-methyltransferase